MTDNRTTELLCKLLEEHGISWKKRRGYIRWSKQTEYGVTHYQAWPCLDGTVTLTKRDEYELTPEQAIAATLGWIEEPDTIRNELADGGLIADALAPVCEVWNTELGSGSAWATIERCPECGKTYEHDGVTHSRCPHCGAKEV